VAWIRKLFSAQSSRFSSRTADGAIKNSILIVSMFYPPAVEAGRYHDPFFGMLHHFLSDKGKYCVYLSDSIHLPTASIKKAVGACRDVSLVMPSALLGWREWGTILLSVFLRRIEIKNASFMGCDFAKLLRWQARRFRYHFNLHAEVYFKAVEKLCRCHNFEQLILNFEGNAFERASLQAVRQNPSMKTCGYNQGVMYPANLKLRITEKERLLRPEPERIVCTGPEAEAILTRMGNREAEHVRPGCALREIPRFSAPTHRGEDSKTILAALDGVYSTAAVLDWLFEHAEIVKDYSVRLRPHPNVPLQEILTQCLHKMPPNFTMSEQNLEEDLRKSFCVFYRHTSIGIQALANGKPAVHLAVDCPLPGDPLEGARLGKWVVHSPEELEKALQEIHRFKKDRDMAQAGSKEFVDGYFASPNDENMGDFLNLPRDQTCLNP
jgi:hypothetical protein